MLRNCPETDQGLRVGRTRVKLISMTQSAYHKRPNGDRAFQCFEDGATRPSLLTTHTAAQDETQRLSVQPRTLTFLLELLNNMLFVHAFPRHYAANQPAASERREQHSGKGGDEVRNQTCQAVLLSEFLQVPKAHALEFVGLDLRRLSSRFVCSSIRQQTFAYCGLRRRSLDRIAASNGS